MKDILLYENVAPLENNFPITFWKQTDDHLVQPHWHEHLEALYVLAGSCDFTCDGKTFSAAANDLIVINSSEIHAFIAKDGVDYFCMMIAPDFFRDVRFSHKILLENLIRQDPYCKKAFSEIYTAYAENTDGCDMVMKGSVYLLIAYLMRNYTVSHLTSTDAALQMAKLKRMHLLLDYMAAHYRENITTKQLADLCFISESHLCRFFKSCIGKTITQYLQEFRIEKAAILLIETDETITNIAFEVGFEDLNYFSRIFKKLRNETPLEYRSKHRHVLV